MYAAFSSLYPCQNFWCVVTDRYAQNEEHPEFHNLVLNVHRRPEEKHIVGRKLLPRLFWKFSHASSDNCPVHSQNAPHLHVEYPVRGQGAVVLTNLLAGFRNFGEKNKDFNGATCRIDTPRFSMTLYSLTFLNSFAKGIFK